MSGHAPRFALFVVLAFVSGCSSYRDDMTKDASDVRDDVATRIGVTPPPWSSDADDGSISPEAAALLDGKLDDQKAVKVALLENRRVRAAFERVGISRAELLKAGLLQNPVFAGNAKFFDGGTEIEWSLAQSFLEIFYVPLRRSVAAADLDAAKAATTRELVHLVCDVRRALADARSAQRTLAIHERLVEAARASLDLMRVLHDAGNVTDADYSAEEAMFTRAQLDAAAAEAAAREMREPVNVLLGLWGARTTWALTADALMAPLEGLVLDHAEARAVAASLDLLENRARIMAAAHRARIDSWESAFSSGSVGVASKKEVGDGEFGFGPDLEFSLPLFDQGQADEAAALAEMRERIAKETSIAVETRAAARLLRDRLTYLTQRMEFLRNVHLPVKRQYVKETLQNYNAMQIGAFDVIAVRRSELAAELDLEETSRAAARARIDLEELFAGSINMEAMTPMSAGAPSIGARDKGDH